MSFLKQIAILLCLATFSHAFSFGGLHTCKQGHKCVYYRGGRLLDTVNEPGYHFKIPVVTSHHDVQTTWQTDRLTDVPCGSSQGGIAHLDIEVVNRLKGTSQCVLDTVREHTVDYDKPIIFDYVPSEVAQFCKNYPLQDIVIREFDKLDEVLLDKLKANVKSYGLEDCLDVKAVRIGRPKLDQEMRRKFEAIEHEQKEKELAEQQKETQRVKLEGQLQKEVMEKEREQKKSEIEQQTREKVAESEARRQAIIDAKVLATRRSEAEAERHRLEQLAKGNEALHTEAHIKLEGYRSAHHNAKLIFGNVPENALIGLAGDPTLAKVASSLAE